MPITILVEDKQALLKALLTMRESGQNYAQTIAEVLVKIYEADPEKIDNESLYEHATGHMISSEQDGHEPKNPHDFLAWLLPMLSDYGLSKMGLTRAKYQEARRRIHEA